MPCYRRAIDTRAAVDWYRRNRARSRRIFDLIDPAAYYSRPIALRNPIVFYEGHLPAFSVHRVPAPRPRPPAGRCAAGEAVRARHRSRHRGRGRPAQRRVDRVAVARRGPRLRARVRRGRPRARMRRRAARAAPRSRASTPRSSTKRCTRRRCSTCGIGCRMSRSDEPVRIVATSRSGRQGNVADLQSRTLIDPGGTATLGADRDDDPSGGTTSSTRTRPRARVRHRHLPRHQRAVPGIRQRRRLPHRELWSDEGWEWVQRIEFDIRRSGVRSQTIEWFWRGMFEDVPLPPTGPSTSARRKRALTRAGRDAG